MPPGLDIHQIINERDSFIEVRISQHINRELEGLDTMISDGGFDSLAGDILGSLTDKQTTALSIGTIEAQSNLSSTHPAPDAHGKLHAMIELKSLCLLEKQHSMCALVAERLIQGTLLPLNCATSGAYANDPTGRGQCDDDATCPLLPLPPLSVTHPYASDVVHIIPRREDNDKHSVVDDTTTQRAGNTMPQQGGNDDRRMDMLAPL
ncbi:hypothetical protein OG21DRAFT_1491712 [Imleria badia]|nr:hypothetical protein OG21DRAFT_1491712 [Imleria badia]